MNNSSLTAKQFLNKLTPVVPVADFTSVDHARVCSQLFHEKSVPSIEITIRRPEAWSCVEECKKNLPNSYIGVGTVVEEDQIKKAADLGVDFIISPGFLPSLAENAQKYNLFYYPGISSASELMLAKSYGFSALKFFPAEAAGGIPMIKSLSGPFPDVVYCPTGGISLKNYKDYLSLSNVICVGSSAVVPTMTSIKDNENECIKIIDSIYSEV